MFNKIFSTFGVESITTKINYFYESLKVNLISSAMMVPWMILNLVIKFSPATFLIYMLAGIWIYPNITTLLGLLKNIYDAEDTAKIKTYIKRYMQLFQSRFLKSVLIGLLCNSAFSVFYLELQIINRHHEIAYSIIPFVVMGGFLIASVVYFLNFQWNDNLKMQTAKKIQLALLVSWKYAVKSFMIALIIILWFSFGYNAPIINILIGNQIIWWVVYKLVDSTMNKLELK